MRLGFYRFGDSERKRCSWPLNKICGYTRAGGGGRCQYDRAEWYGLGRGGSKLGCGTRLIKVRRRREETVWLAIVRSKWLQTCRLQDIVLRRGVCAQVHPVSAPPTRIAHTIALLLHAYCAIYDPPPTALVYAIHHTILVMAISRKGQLQSGAPSNNEHGSDSFVYRAVEPDSLIATLWHVSHFAN